MGKSLFGGVQDAYCLGGDGNSIPVKGGDAFRSGAVVITPPIVSMELAGIDFATAFESAALEVIESVMKIIPLTILTGTDSIVPFLIPRVPIDNANLFWRWESIGI